MTYARARLYLGITTVGFFVVLSVVLLFFKLPSLWFVSDPPESLLTWPAIRQDLVALLVITLSYAALHLPFDFLGGYFLPSRYMRPHPDADVFVGQWLRGVLGQVLLYVVFGMIIMVIVRFTSQRTEDAVSATAVVALLMLILLVAQPTIAAVVSGSTKVAADTKPILENLDRWGISRPDALRVVFCSDPGFVGGITGLPGRETVVLPYLWVNHLEPEAVAIQVARRMAVQKSGSRIKGVTVAILFNLLGFYVAATITHSDLRTVAGLLSTSLGFTVWSFLGLLILPSLSRTGVIEADQRVVAAGAPKDLLMRVIQDLDRLQDDEPQRTRAIETIFHPIPSVNNRLAGISSGSPVQGPWNTARTALYLSWAGLSLLPRAVHCNVGRAQLWVMFPGD